MQVRRFSTGNLCAQALAAGALLASPAAQASEQSISIVGGDGEVGNIIGGEQTMSCGWATTVTTGGCTASLIHPKVLSYAKHCISNPSITATFGDDRTGSFKVSGTCTGSNDGSDWGYCVLDQEVTGIRPIPPLHGCEAELFKQMIGEEVWVVGFGMTQPVMGTPVSPVKRELALELVSVGQEITVSGDRSKGLCQGDSGGPTYVRLKNMDGSDGGWRMAGQTHGPGPGATYCDGPTNYSLAWPMADAVLANEGIDVTPCTDENGDWDPGPECQNIPSNPRDVGGSWGGSPTAPSCSELDLVIPETCGKNPNNGDDTTSDESTSDETSTSEDTSTSTSEETSDSTSEESSDSESNTDDTADTGGSTGEDSTDVSGSESGSTSGTATGDGSEGSDASQSGEASDSASDSDSEDSNKGTGDSGGCSVPAASSNATWLAMGLALFGFGATRRRRRS